MVGMDLESRRAVERALWISLGSGCVEGSCLGREEVRILTFSGVDIADDISR
jgi:hypothetical protein